MILGLSSAGNWPRDIQSGSFGLGLSRSSGSPESIGWMPAGWPADRCGHGAQHRELVRDLRLHRQKLGEAAVPGTFVEIVLNGPRYSLLISGFGS